MKLKKLIVLGVAVCMFAGQALSVSAAGLRDIFDAEYYLEQNPDLKATCGEDANVLYRHFVTSGVKEGRNMSPILDVAAYRKAYPDLDKAFGDNWDAYVNHYYTCGIQEHRTGGVLFNPLEYADAYEDIKDAYGDDIPAIINHYLVFGRKENRTAGTANGYASLADRQAFERPEHHTTIQRSVTTSFGYILYEYNEFGQVTKEEIVYPTERIYVKEWDKFGKLLRDAILDSNAKVDVETIYTYYPNGILAKSVYYERKVNRKCVKEYDLNGKFISETKSLINR